METRRRANQFRHTVVARKFRIFYELAQQNMTKMSLQSGIGSWILDSEFASFEMKLVTRFNAMIQCDGTRIFKSEFTDDADLK